MTTLVCDTREPATIISAIRTCARVDLEVVVTTMDFDYRILGHNITIGIERKTGMDYLASLSDGRLYEQGKALVEQVDLPIVCVTDPITCTAKEKAFVKGTETHWNYWAIMMHQLSLASGGVNVTYTTEHVFPEWLVRAGAWASKEQHLQPRRRRLPFESLDPRLAVLACFPGIDQKYAGELLKKYGSLRAALAAVGEWDTVKGIGPKKMAAIEEFMR